MRNSRQSFPRHKNSHSQGGGGKRLTFETLEDRRVMALTIGIANNSVVENAGTVTATVTRTGTSLSGSLTVSLSSNDKTEATVPLTVQILSNQASASFTITIIDDLIVDGDVPVTISATSLGQTGDTEIITVRNNDLVTLTNSNEGDVLELSRGPQAGLHTLAIGPAVVTAGSAPWYASFGSSATYQTAGSDQSIQADEFFPVDLARTYALSGWAKSGDEFGQRYQPNNEQSFGIASYDADLLEILPKHVLRFTGATDTTLSTALNPGDTVIRLTSAAGWSNAAGQSAHSRALAWYGYQNSAGTTYANYTYTRNVASGGDSGLWAPGAVNGNIITLATPWAGPALAAGTAIRNSTGGDDDSMLLIDSAPISGDWNWTQQALTFGGQVLQNGTDSQSQFRPGTAYVKPVIIANEQGTINNFISWRDVSISRVPPSTTVADLALPIVNLAGAGTDLRSPLSFHATSNYSWATHLVQVNTAQAYTLSARATQTVTNDDPLVQFASLDIDKKLIHPLHVTKHAYATDTTLTAALKPGDTSFLVNNASGWSNDTSESAQTRALAWYGYSDSTGHTYANYSYTRNVASDFDNGLWAPGGIRYDNAAGAYRVTLLKPWSGPTVAAGAAIRNATSGAIFNELTTPPTAVPNTTLFEFSATIAGETWQNGNRNETTFRPGTAYIQPVLAGPPPFSSWTDLSIGRQQDVVTLGKLYFPKPQVDIAANGQFQLDLDVLSKNVFNGATTVTISGIAPPQFGTAAIVAGPNGRNIIRYQAPAGFVGIDVVNYTLRNTATNTTVSLSTAITVQNAADDVVLERMRGIALAMSYYENVFRRLPVNGSGNFDTNGQPRLSWRVHILPYLGYQDLYNQFHLNEAWNSTHNQTLLSQMPDFFRSAGDAANSTTTRFQTFTGLDAPFGNREAGEQQLGPRLSEFIDGLAHTVLFVEAGANMAVAWTKPDDLEFNINNPLAALGTITTPKINVMMADSNALELRSTIDAGTFKAIVTPAGGETVDAFTLRRQFAEANGGAAAVESYGESTENRYFQNIALAMLNYADAKKSFPFPGGSTSTSFDANGYPKFSWRVAILPFLGYQNLYDQFRLDEAWDSSHNLAVANQMPDLFRSAGDASDSTTTRVMTFTGRHAPFLNLPVGNQQSGPRYQQIQDGTSDTIMFVEAGADKADVWTKPIDLPFDLSNPLSALGNLSDGEIRVAMFDGSIFRIGADIHPDIFTMLVTPQGQSPINGIVTDRIYLDGQGIADREKQRRGIVETQTQTTNNLKQLTLAMLNFESAQRRFPVDRVSTTGSPLLSWRVLLLPYIEQGDLYAQFHLNEPWDSPHNLSLLKYMPDVYRSVGDPADSTTTRVTTFTGPGAPFPTVPASNSSGITYAGVRDGTSNTFQMIEAGEDIAIPWTKPSDTPFHPNGPYSPLGLLGSKFIAAMFDGSVHTFSSSMSISELAARITHNGQEVLTNPPTIPNVPGFYVRQSAGNTKTNEFGVDWFDIVLDKAPLSNVVLSLNSSATSAAVLDKSTLTFTSANWNVPQRVAVRGVDNHVVNADRTVDITVAVVDAQSAMAYQSVATQVFSAIVIDDDLLPGDFDGSGTVNGADLVVWQAAYGVNATGDADGDGDSDGRDFLIWQRNTVAVLTLAGDFDRDTDVDNDDLAVWRTAYGVNGDADADGDGDSDGRDFLVWQRNYAPSTPLIATLVDAGEPTISLAAAVESPLRISEVNQLTKQDLIDAAFTLAMLTDDLQDSEEAADLTSPTVQATFDLALAEDDDLLTAISSTPLKSTSGFRPRTGKNSFEARLDEELLEQLVSASHSEGALGDRRI